MYLMIVTSYENATDFLQKARAYLEQNEALNGLMLGLAFRLAEFAGQIKTAPFLAIVEDEGGLAIASLMTPPHKLILYSDRDNPNDALTALAQHLQGTNWTFPAVLGQAPVAESFARIWADLVGTTYTVGMRQRCFELRQVHHPAYPAGRLRVATAVDTDIITEWILAFHEEALEPIDWTTAREMANGRIREGDFYVWEDNTPVSMAAKVRPTANGMAISLVYTPHDWRQRGYASACVAAFSQLLLDEGWQFCTLFTDLANPTSNSIYQKIGYKSVGDFNDYVFAKAANL
jgi:predicted GNAT family acetyltransferase